MQPLGKLQMWLYLPLTTRRCGTLKMYLMQIVPHRLVRFSRSLENAGKVYLTAGAMSYGIEKEGNIEKHDEYIEEHCAAVETQEEDHAGVIKTP